MHPRQAALLSLIRCEKDRKYANLELSAAIEKYGFEGVDRSFFTRLVYGVVERRITLDYCITKVTDRPVGELHPMVLNILRCGVYQILYMDRVPDSAACDEAVKLAHRYIPKAAGFVNGALRGFIRSREGILASTKALPSAERAEVLYSIPRWMLAMWSEQYGEETMLGIAEHSLTLPPLTLRVNTPRTSRAEVLERLAKADIPARAGKLSPGAILVESSLPIEKLPGFEEGLFTVQDEASQLCVDTLDARPGMRVIDTCACPGGKSIGAAIAMDGEGEVFSLDLHENKLGLITKSAQRLGINNITTRAHDGRSAAPDLIGTADRIICDVPCSGLGVIAKKPDIRYKAPEEIAPLPQLQKRILAASLEYLKPGGVLVYSTCTLNRAENEEVVQAVLEGQKQYQITFQRTLFPHIDGCDGFFLCKIEKVIVD